MRPKSSQRTPKWEYIPAGEQPEPPPEPAPAAAGPPNLEFLSPLPDIELFADQAAGAIGLARSIPPAAWLAMGALALIIFRRD